MTSRPGAKPSPKSYKEAKTQIQKTLGNSGSPNMSQYPNMFPGGLDPSALMSMPLLNQSLMGYGQPNAAAAQAALMMAGMTGLSGAQAQQAMQELLQQQGQMMAGAARAQQQQQQQQQIGRAHV